MTDDEEAIGPAIDTALDRTVEAQEAFEREPLVSEQKPGKADVVAHRAEDLERLAIDDAEQSKRQAT
jgi:hypothetical protein